MLCSSPSQGPQSGRQGTMGLVVAREASWARCPVCIGVFFSLPYLAFPAVLAQSMGGKADCPPFSQGKMASGGLCPPLLFPPPHRGLASDQGSWTLTSHVLSQERWESKGERRVRVQLSSRFAFRRNASMASLQDPGCPALCDGHGRGRLLFPREAPCSSRSLIATDPFSVLQGSAIR